MAAADDTSKQVKYAKSQTKLCYMGLVDSNFESKLIIFYLLLMHNIFNVSKTKDVLKIHFIGELK